MKRLFGAGQYDAVDERSIPPGGVKKAVNVEYVENYLEKLTEPEYFNETLNNYILSIVNQISDFWIWYAPKMPTNATGDLLYIVFNGTGLFAIYEISGGYNSYEVDIDGVDYTSDSVIRLTPGKDKLKIVDGVNRPHYIKVTEEGNIISGKLGYKAPTSKAFIEGMTVWDGNKFQEIEDAVYAAEICIVEICYAYKDKFNNISNVSPISSFMADQQWFEIDEELKDIRWIKHFTYSGLELPDGIDDEVKGDIDEFIIYRRVSRFSESGEPSNFLRCMSVNIVDKSSTTDANIYVDATLTDNTASTPDINNDIPPVAHYIEEVDNVTVYGDVEENLTFPFPFKWYSKINVNNPNSFSYKGGSIRLRLREAALDNFTVADFISGATISNTQHIRIIDTDITTMLPVIMYGFDIGTGNRDGWIDIKVYIPQLVRTKGDTLYLVFTDAANMAAYTGVSDKYNIAGGTETFGFLHGRFCQDSINWTQQQTLFPIMCKSENNIVCSPMNEQAWGQSGIANRANTANIGDASVGVVYLGTQAFAFSSLINKRTIGKDCIKFPTSNNYSSVNYGNLYGDNNESIATAKGYIKLDAADLQDYIEAQSTYYNRYYNVICGNYGKSSAGYLKGWFLGLERYKSIVKPILVYKKESSNTPVVKEFNNYQFPATGIKNIFYKISVDFSNQKAHLYMIDSTESILCDVEIDDLDDNFDSSTEEKEDVVLGNNFSGNYTGLYSGLPMYHIFNSIWEAYYDQFDFYKETYINNAENICIELASFMPYWDVQHVGWNGSTHDNIVFEDVKDNEVKRRKNKVVWTAENSENVPATNEKNLKEPITGLIYAKSFLNYQYAISTIIPTRNSINRLVMEGDSSGWANEKNMIKEFTQYGKQTYDFVSMGEAYYYGSEVGANRWSPSGMNIISNAKINGIWQPRINIIIKPTTRVIPIPVRNQVLYYNNDDQQGWLYHENGDRWTEVNNLNIQGYAILTKGDRLDNKTLFLANNVLKSYPGSNYTGQTQYVITQQYDLEDNKLRKIKADFEGDCSILTTVTNHAGSTPNANEHINKMEWYNMVSGSWGYMYQHVISLFTKLKSIEEKAIRR